MLSLAVLRFDIAGNVPPGSVINSATLTMTVTRSGDNQDAPMTLHPLSGSWSAGVVNCDAVRGGGQGLDATTGDPTWLDAQYQQVAWSTPGADFGVASASSLVGVGNGSEGIWDSSSNPAMLLDVQSWSDDPANNFGWIVIADESRSSTARRFSSSEGNSTPTLVIDFTGDGFGCCFANGDCSIQVEEDCNAQGGIPDLNQTSCEPNFCYH